jgi:hypothetical protein
MARPKVVKARIALSLRNIVRNGDAFYTYLQRNASKGKTLQQRLAFCGVTSPKVRLIHTKELTDIDKLVKTGGYRFVIIDSVQHVKMTYDEFEILRQKYKRRKLSWHLVMQMGVSLAQWKHEVDVLIEVKNGFAYAQGRYGKADRMQVLVPQSAQGTLF